jgi:hypothetical protein
MGRRTVKISYTIEVELDATVEWPDRQPTLFGSDDGDDPREMTAVIGATPRDQELLDVLLRHDNEKNDLWDRIQSQVLERHGSGVYEDMVWDRVAAEVRRQFEYRGKGDQAARDRLHEVQAALSTIRREAREAAFAIEDETNPEKPFTDGEVELVAYMTLDPRTREAIEPLLKRRPRSPEPFPLDPLDV